MQILRLSRPQSQIVERNILPVSVPKPRRILEIDETFMKEPVDTRKLKPEELPTTPDFDLEQELAVPISMLASVPVSHNTTPTTPTRHEIETIEDLLEKIERVEKKPKRIYHLSQNLRPPSSYKFCPEAAHANQIIEKTTKKTMHKDLGKIDMTRKFPYDLFLTSSKSKSKKNLNRHSLPSKPEPTFDENDIDLGVFTHCY